MNNEYQNIDLDTIVYQDELPIPPNSDRIKKYGVNYYFYLYNNEEIPVYRNPFEKGELFERARQDLADHAACCWYSLSIPIKKFFDTLLNGGDFSKEYPEIAKLSNSDFIAYRESQLNKYNKIMEYHHRCLVWGKIIEEK